MVSEYVGDIFEYFKELERDTMPSANYMENQKELAWRMRGILIDWLIEVHYKFRLLPETLFLAVNVIDRFLTCRIVSVQKLQLVGLTSLFIASKYEEVMAPSIQNFIYMSDNGYTEDEIMKAERYILQVLDYGLQYPNALNFLRRCSKADNYDIQTRTLAKYLMEVALIDYKCLVCPPSEIAAAGLYLARRMLRRGPWDANLVHYSGYTEDKLQTATSLMLQYLRQTPPRHEALFRKYASKKFMKASLFVKDWVERQSANTVSTSSRSGYESELN
ncbi:hypothetical protein M427DRAFT_99746 [Gonapodya prolifera JEL478]|uniref:Uncharacterized protein n=1 Tax=Gonapodya prolifera (strain JEL478) TaxID=1344416 RepID=A0A139AD11_GONPJ|nr:hypothetical protein M427DRAFT_99746 [Gonapodya prolifera JEL478]|eukprot:KXS14303.1 hypothetical protein M427DRAFT_99746 [Gonapodya prolifera JEL478]